jgi:hypothetical protein
MGVAPACGQRRRRVSELSCLSWIWIPRHVARGRDCCSGAGISHRTMVDTTKNLLDRRRKLALLADLEGPNPGPFFVTGDFRRDAGRRRDDSSRGYDTSIRAGRRCLLGSGPRPTECNQSEADSSDCPRSRWVRRCDLLLCDHTRRRGLACGARPCGAAGAGGRRSCRLRKRDRHSPHNRLHGCISSCTRHCRRHHVRIRTVANEPRVNTYHPRPLKNIAAMGGRFSGRE